MNPTSRRNARHGAFAIGTDPSISVPDFSTVPRSRRIQTACDMQRVRLARARRRGYQRHDPRPGRTVYRSIRAARLTSFELAGNCRIANPREPKHGSFMRSASDWSSCARTARRKDGEQQRTAEPKADGRHHVRRTEAWPAGKRPAIDGSMRMPPER